MRKITTISIHTSLNKTPSNDNPEFLHRVHVNENNWKEIGYHIYINKRGDWIDSTINPLMRNITKTPAAVKGHNTGMIAICLGGVDYNDFTEAQYNTLRRGINNLMREYGISREQVKGHNEYSGHNNRGCPNFDVARVLWDTKGIKQTY